MAVSDSWRWALMNMHFSRTCCDFHSWPIDFPPVLTPTLRRPSNPGKFSLLLHGKTPLETFGYSLIPVDCSSMFEAETPAYR